GIKVVKGPKHAVDIPMLLRMYDLRRLSPDVPADTILIKEMREYAEKILEKTEMSIASKPHIDVNGTLIPVDPPPIRVMSEISEAHLLNEEELIRAVRRRIEEGADLIGLGFQAGVADPEKVKKFIRLIKREFDFPLVLDSIIPSEIVAGVEAGVDMVMSLEAGNIRKVADKIRRIPAVVIPYDSRRNFFARTVEDKLRLLEMNIKSALEHNVENLIADPVLEPINLSSSTGTFQSLRAYCMFKRERPGMPLLMGLCNVVELIDVDSVGVNALLTMLAAEIGVSLILVVEKSVKTAGSTAEAKIAVQMATIAWEKGTPPKDLGLSLLMFKDKRRVETNLDINGAMIVEAGDKNGEYLQDPLGFFTIRVNHKDERIEVLYSGMKGKILIRGRTASSIYKEILRRRLLSELSHALYLGVELGRAEEALGTGKSYVQEESLFELTKPIGISK
ncbi:TPA: dihydropteroate synthase-like protein, partial [Candidatus Bathyarchaeota archaeon]|nr:dihydropteroate synthase-like protein [Candidatus Bathyarchaeota archaeon]